MMKFLPSAVLLMFTCCALSSCYVNRYQRVNTTWENQHEDPSVFHTQDSVLKINYSLWNAGGQVNTIVTNISNQNVYIQPYYTVEIIDKVDTLAISSYTNCVVTDSLNVKIITDHKMAISLDKGIEIEIPPGGKLTIRSVHLNSYIGLDYIHNDPAANSEMKLYTPATSPVNYQRQIAYATGNSDHLNVVRHTLHVSSIDKYRFIGSNIVPETAGRPTSFYVLSRRPSIISWIGLIGTTILLAVADGSTEGE